MRYLITAVLATLGCSDATLEIPEPSTLGSESHVSSSTDGDTASGTSSSDSADPTEPTQTYPMPPVDRIVIAGDSWSAGSLSPTRALLDLHGYEDIELAWENTAVSGSRASEWAVNHEGKLDHLSASLDGGATGADLLLLYLGGNDYNAALHRGLSHAISRDRAIDELTAQIQDDLQALIDHAIRSRPGLEVVIVGYDYFHFDWMELLYGMNFDADDTLAYNQGLARLEARKRDLALGNDRVHYVHNLGILTHELGNPVTPPFTNPLIDVPPHFFDAPVGPPSYEPFPGGARRDDLLPTEFPPESLPGPAHAYLDGIHLNDKGWDTLLSHSWESVLGPVIEAR
ncbi:MAG: hypothetical protein EA397_16805 [Deltaproteobacteria bacterium]|nr:MAG: hypothetical protein EA397_16805 [Deltaproteobacteria bacterium]